MARRWGTTPEALRETLTDEQFDAYLKIERAAQGEDRILAAYGVQAAVADLLASKKLGALEKFANIVRGDDASDAARRDTNEGAKLRKRIHSFLAQTGEAVR